MVKHRFPAVHPCPAELHTADREVLTGLEGVPQEGVYEQGDDDPSTVTLPLTLTEGNALCCEECAVNPADTLNASPSLGTTSFQSQPRRTALWAVGTRTGAKYFAGGLEILFRTPG